MRDRFTTMRKKSSNGFLIDDLWSLKLSSTGVNHRGDA
jgi:hypothetical protein